MLFSVAETFVVQEGLQADDLEVAVVAHLADLSGGFHLVRVCEPARERFGEVFKVFVEDLHPFVLVGNGLIELLRKLVHPGPAQRHTSYAELVGHCSQFRWLQMLAWGLSRLLTRRKSCQAIVSEDFI